MENAKNDRKCGEKCRAICQMERNGIFYRGMNACITTRVSAMMRTDETDRNTEKLIKDRKDKNR